MYKNKKMATFVASVCALSIVSCSVGIVSFADEENVISNENFETMDSFKDYITSTQGNISINGINSASEDTMINLVIDNSCLDSEGFITKDVIMDIPINIEDNPTFTQANMNLSIANQEGLELNYSIDSNTNLTAEKSGNDIVLSCNDAFISNDALFVAHVTIPKNTVKNGDMFDIKLSNVELVNGENKYLPNIPEYVYFVITDDSTVSGTVIVGRPIEEIPPENTTTDTIIIDTTVTTTTTYGSVPTGTGFPETTTTPIPTDTTITTTTRITTTTKLTSTEPSDTTTTVSSKKEDNKSDTTTTKISKKDTDTSKSNTSSNTKASSNSSKTSSSKESTSVEKEEKSMNTGSKGILGIIVAGLVSMSTAVAIRKKS